MTMFKTDDRLLELVQMVIKRYEGVTPPARCLDFKLARAVEAMVKEALEQMDCCEDPMQIQSVTAHMILEAGTRAAFGEEHDF